MKASTVYVVVHLYYSLLTLPRALKYVSIVEVCSTREAAERVIAREKQRYGWLAEQENEYNIEEKIMLH